MRLLVALALLALLALPSRAETPAPPAKEPAKEPAKTDPWEGDSRRRVKLTLEEALRAALDANLDLAYSRLEPQLYDGDTEAFRGDYDPIPYIDVNGSTSHTPTANVLSGASVLNDRLWTAAVGVKGNLLLGTTYDFNFQGSRDDSNTAFATTNPKWNSSVGFSLRQPLLHNAWLDYQTITLRILVNSHDSSVHHVSQDTIATLYIVEFDYWTLVSKIAQLAVKQRAFQVAEKLYEVNKNKVKAGALAPIEELRAESEVASRKGDIIIARADIETAMDELRRQIRPFDQPSDWDFIIEPADPAAYDAKTVDLEASVGEALATRPELEQLKIAIDTAQLDAKRFERDLLPQLDLTGSVRYSGLGGNFGDSLEGIRTWQYDTWSIGVILEYPLGTHSAHGGLVRAEAAERRATIALRNQEQTVVLEVRNAARDVNSASERIATTEVATRLARRALEAEQARFDRGLTTSHVLLQFLSDLQTAEAAEETARVDYKIATLKLRKATGRILTERAGQ